MAKKMTGPQWQQSAGMFIAGQEHVDEMDLTVIAMEQKYGVGRLRLLVPIELREKFDRQDFKFQRALYDASDPEELKVECQRMIKAWHAVDKAAGASGKPQLDPAVLEVALGDGRALAIVRTAFEAHRVAKGRAMAVVTVEEVARLFEASEPLVTLLAAFPGARVTGVRKTVDSPVRALEGCGKGLDDEIPF